MTAVGILAKPSAQSQAWHSLNDSITQGQPTDPDPSKIFDSDINTRQITARKSH